MIWYRIQAPEKGRKLIVDLIYSFKKIKIFTNVSFLKMYFQKSIFKCFFKEFFS